MIHCDHLWHIRNTVRIKSHEYVMKIICVECQKELEGTMRRSWKKSDT